MQPPLTPRDAATAALGEDVGMWIDRQRKGAALLSWQQVARILAAQTGITVSRESIRLWHVDTHTASAA